MHPNPFGCPQLQVSGLLSFRNANPHGHGNGFTSARRQIFSSTHFSLWMGRFSDEVEEGGLVMSDFRTTHFIL